MKRVRPLLAKPMLAAIVLLASASVATTEPVVTLNAGGELGDALVVGDVAYLGQGATVSVWQLSSDGMAAPVRVGATEVLPGAVRGLAVSGDYLFASWATQEPYGELVVFSIADPLNPVRMLDFAYSAGSFLRPGDMVVVGDSLLLTDPESGVYSIDISDPLAPSVDTMLWSFGLRRLAVTGSHLVGWGAGFIGFAAEIFDISDPSIPATVGYYSSFGVFENAAVDGDLMVLVGDGIEVVSLTDPAMPVMLAVVPPTGTFLRSALLRDDLAYIGDANGIQVWNLSTPTNPTAGTLVAAPADRTELNVIHQISGGVEALMFTGMGRGMALDLGTPASPTLEHVFDTPVGTDSIDVAGLDGGGLAVADFYSGLRVADGSLASLGRVDPPIQQGGYESVVVSGTTAYMTSWGYGLHIIDLSDPNAPAELGSTIIPYASGVDVNGTLAYVVTSTNGGVFQVIDVANPALLIPRGSLPITHGLDVVYHDGLALIADQDWMSNTGLRVIDVSNPDAPFEVGAYADCTSAGGVAVRGDLAFVACHDGSMHVVSLADPAMPVQVGVYSDPDVYLSGNAVEVDGNVVWFGHTAGVDLLDVSDPAAPTSTIRLELGAAVRGIDVGEDRSAWVAASVAGVYRVDNSAIFSDGFESGDLSTWSSVVE